MRSFFMRLRFGAGAKHHQISSNIAKHEDDDTTKRMPTTNEKAVAVGKQESKDRSDTS
jgi:hypothetical protein